jgi:uncharacterized protein
VRHEQPDQAMTNATGGPVPEQKRPFRLALGIERFGLIPLRFPIPSVIAFIALAVLAAIGVMRIQTDDSLSQLFRS